MSKLSGTQSQSYCEMTNSVKPLHYDTAEILTLNSHIQEGLYITDGQSRIVYANTALHRILGYSDGSGLSGRKPEEIFGEEFLQQSMDLRSRQFKDGDVEAQKEIVIKTWLHNGTVKWISIIPHPNLHGPGTNGVVTDLTNTRNAELKWHETNVFYKTIVELSPDAITFASLDGTITDLNEKAQLLFACRDKSVAVGKSVFEFAAVEERNRLTKILEEFLSGGDVLHVETNLMRFDGTCFSAEICAKKVPVANSSMPILMILSRDISERKTYEANLKALAVTDSLTKLLNRRGFSIAADQELRHAKRNKTGVALFFIDIDNMKMINDSFGHEWGDTALKMVAETLQSSFRNSDILARWGGDEFVVFVHDLSSKSDEMLLKRMNMHLENLNNSEKLPLEVSITVGMAICEPHEDKPLSFLLKEADLHMYQNKKRR